MNFENNLDAPFSHLLWLASDEIGQTRAELPKELASALDEIALLLEEFPSQAHEAEGMASNQLGLFEGADAADSSSPQMPRIVLWLGNIWEMCGANEADYREEVRITLLHELGHYLGFVNKTSLSEAWSRINPGGTRECGPCIRPACRI
jgi:predicted Zn-dependent protease with MMP-like domain